MLTRQKVCAQAKLLKYISELICVSKIKDKNTVLQELERFKSANSDFSIILKIQRIYSKN